MQLVVIDDDPGVINLIIRQIRPVLQEQMEGIRFTVIVPTEGAPNVAAWPDLVDGGFGNRVSFHPVQWRWVGEVAGVPDMARFVDDCAAIIRGIPAHSVLAVVCDFMLRDVTGSRKWYWNYAPDGGRRRAGQPDTRWSLRLWTRLWTDWRPSTSRHQGLVDLMKLVNRPDWLWAWCTSHAKKAFDTGMHVWPKTGTLAKLMLADRLREAVDRVARSEGTGLCDQLQAFAALRNFPFKCMGGLGHSLTGGPYRCPACRSIVDHQIDLASSGRHDGTCPDPTKSLWHLLFSDDRFVCACQVCIAHLQRAADSLAEVQHLLPSCPHGRPAGMQIRPEPWSEFVRYLLLTYNPQRAILEGLLTEPSGPRVLCVDFRVVEEQCCTCGQKHWVRDLGVQTDAVPGVGTQRVGSCVVKWRFDRMADGSTNAPYGIAEPVWMHHVGVVMRHNVIKYANRSLFLIGHRADGVYWLRAKHVVEPASLRRVREEELESWEAAAWLPPDPPDRKDEKVYHLLRGVLIHGGTVAVWQSGTSVKSYGAAFPLLPAPTGGHTFTLDIGLPIVESVSMQFWSDFTRQRA